MSNEMRINNLTLRLGDPTKDYGSIPNFDFTKLSAINTCPRWGLIRYHNHLRMPGNGRNLALELGSAAHLAFECYHWFQLFEYGADHYPDMNDAIVLNGLQSAFGAESGKIYDFFTSKEDQRRRCIAAMHHVCEVSGFYDDPYDRRRTMNNLCDSIQAFVDRSDIQRSIPVYDSKSGFVGVELPFLFEVWKDGKHLLNYTGKVDVLSYDTIDKKYLVEDHKTASRMGDAWLASWSLSHQITGYCVAGGLMLNQDKPVDEGVIHGMAIPLPKGYDMGGVARLPVDRSSPFRFEQWSKWLLDTYAVYERYHDNPLEAPEFTHSCNRYFHACSFIPLCDSTDKEEQHFTYNQLVKDEWNPLTRHKSSNTGE